MINIDYSFIISVIAILLSIYSLYTQRRHNRLSFKPIPSIVKYNYSEHISVKLWNKGTGPLILKSLEFNGKKNLIDALPKEVKACKFVEYINDFNGRTLAAGDSLNLIEFKIRKEKDKNLNEYLEALEKIKISLTGKRINIIYKNIYNNKSKYSSETLNFKDSKDELIVDAEMLV